MDEKVCGCCDGASCTRCHFCGNELYYCDCNEDENSDNEPFFFEKYISKLGLGLLGLGLAMSICSIITENF